MTRPIDVANLLFALLVLPACLFPLPKPGTCECVCTWRQPAGETGRFFLTDLDGGVQR